MRIKPLFIAALLLGGAALGMRAAIDDDNHESSIIDEVVWVVGDEMIMKSDIEQMRMQAQQEGVRFSGNPDCAIPEQIALQKLFVHQAAIDSIEVTEAEVATSVEEQISFWISRIGSREKLEEYKHQTIPQIRAELRDQLRDQMLAQRMREELVKDIKVTPGEVKQYFAKMPADSIPFVPQEVEVSIITMTPKVPQEEIDAVKEDLRRYTEQVNSGRMSFQALARMYSEEPGAAATGGELDYIGRGMLDPAFANVAFNLTDPSKVSKIVESEFGFHIIQLVDKRGDKIKCRHILRKPYVSQEVIDKAMNRLDSIANDIRAEKFSFEEAASYISDDKDTRYNHGVMYNAQSMNRTSRFKLSELPAEVAKVVDTMQVAQISNPFTMINNRGKTVTAIVKLNSRTEGHRATISGDYQVLQELLVTKRKGDFIKEWVTKKLKAIHVQMKDSYKDCEFEYDGWVK